VDIETGVSDWADRLRGDRLALKQLTLNDVARMSARREVDGWYVAPFGRSRWTIGRRLRGEHYPVVLGAQALTFESKAGAERYLRALLLPTGVEHDCGTRRKLTIAEAQPEEG
jgi:cytochrome bd-type quinol oxidase subunit 1